MAFNCLLMLPGIVISDKFQRYSSSMDHLKVVISAFFLNSNILLLDWRILKFRKKNVCMVRRRLR